MMPIHQAYIPILAATAAEVVISMLWYSDNLFGPIWKKVGGKSSGSKDFYIKLGIHLIASMITATALFIAIAIFQKTQMAEYTQKGLGQLFSIFLHNATSNNSLLSSMKIAGFLWLGFFMPTDAIYTAWSSYNWQKFLIKTGCKLASLIAMATMIASLS